MKLIQKWRWIILLFVAHLSSAQSNTDFLFARQIGPKVFPGGGALIYDMVVVEDGSTYITGYYSGKVDFDPAPGPADTFFLETDFHGTLFIQKLDAAGQLVWAKSSDKNAPPGQVPKSFGNAITTDNIGNLYVTGYFSATVDFDLSTNPADTFFLTSPLSTHFLSPMFVLKMDGAGNFIWVSMFDGPVNDFSYSHGKSIATDNQYVYVSGIIKGKTDFDPGPAPADTFYLNSNNSDVFTLKLDALTGALEWVKKTPTNISVTTSRPELNSIAIDGSGNVYNAGQFMHTVDFDPGTAAVDTFYLTSASIDAFLLKLDSSGNFVWVKITSSPKIATVYDIFIDQYGHIFQTGRFVEKVDVDPGSAPSDTFYLNSDGGDAFIQKLDTSGAFYWGICTSGDSGHSVYGQSIAIDPVGNIYLAGLLRGLTDLNPGTTAADTFFATSNGVDDFFVLKLDVSGNFLWAGNGGGIGDDEINVIALDTGSNIWAGGHFENSVDFNLSRAPADTFFLNVAGLGDGYILKLGRCYNSNDVIFDTSCAPYISPSGRYTWTTSGTYEDTISNIVGCDSFVTIHLTVNNPTAALLNITSCGTYQSPSGRYSWNVSGTYQDTIINTKDCDSVVTVQLVVNHPSSHSFSDTACQNYHSPSGKYTWTSSGTYRDTIVNVHGCDSTLIIFLYIEQLDTAVQMNAAQLTALESGSNASYQWLDCDSAMQAIPMATNAAFTPTKNGSYAIAIAKSVCIDTSSCYQITELGLEGGSPSPSHLQVYPNPFNGNFSVELQQGIIRTVTVRDLQGKTVFQQDLEEKKSSTEIVYSFVPGTYLLEVITEEGKKLSSTIMKR